MQITPINYNYTNRSYSKNNMSSARQSFGVVKNMRAPKAKLEYTKDDMVEFFLEICSAVERNKTRRNEKLITQINHDICKTYEAILAKHNVEKV